MLILRFLGVIALLLVFAGVLAYFVTTDRRYLRFSWRVFTVAIGLALFIFALLALERLAVIALPF